jgi:ADP-dependent NAD(P)H-hydrate dehydratase / NAD(P)H-hydrate epimerase
MMESLPAWLESLPDAAQQRALDEWAISERGIPGLELMERAGAGLAEVVRRAAPEGRIAVVCGKGNNGGDGLVAARLLRESGRDAVALLLTPPAELSPDAAANFERLPADACGEFLPERLADAAAVIDAILGTGFAGEAREPAAGAIAAINEAGRDALVVACDVPSGVDASTGEIAGPAVSADHTVTFHAAKPGLWIAPGKGHAGEVSVIDIGIPAEGRPMRATIGLIGPDVVAAVPRRGRHSTKFSAGSVLVCGGSPGLTGAPALASMAAMRAGAGYVTAGVAASLASIFGARLLEVMSALLPDDSGALGADALQPALERAGRVDAVVLGPGIGREPATAAFVRDLAIRVPVPLVLDADGLNAHSKAAGGSLVALAGRSAATVLTPHAGELARLLATDSAAVEAARLRLAREAARIAGATVVLKGDDTIVCDASGRVAVSRGDAPALATAGTGDVLGGIVGAYLAKGMDPFTAACAAVFVHAEAGRLAAEPYGPEGVIAGDVIALLPQVLARRER